MSDMRQDGQDPAFAGNKSSVNVIRLRIVILRVADLE